MTRWMIYGANGYTGDLAARLAVARGERPILAGRSAGPVAALAGELGLEHRVADVSRVADILDGVAAVAHCAGPFAATFRPMVDACLGASCHYLDITGELDVFEAVFARHDEAAAAGVVLLPGAGFDVVPTDCLAGLLAARLPGAVSLELAFLSRGGQSRGTAKTGLAGIAAGGRRRIGGALRPTPLGVPSRLVPFPSGPREVGAVPWGDLATAYRSTGIGDITVYTRVPVRGGLAQRLLSFGPARAMAARAIDRRPPGPSAETRAATGVEVWGEVRSATGEAVSGTLTGPNAYAMSADAVVRAASLLCAGEGPAPGAHTPATAFGADFVRSLDGVTVAVP